MAPNTAKCVGKLQTAQIRLNSPQKKVKLQYLKWFDAELQKRLRPTGFPGDLYVFYWFQSKELSIRSDDLLLLPPDEGEYEERERMPILLEWPGSNFLI